MRGAQVDGPGFLPLRSVAMGGSFTDAIAIATGAGLMFVLRASILICNTMML
jgi:hypothetical protein